MLSVLMTYIRSYLPKSEQGQDLIEYALLSGLIAASIIAVLALGVLTGAITGMANGIAGCVDFQAGGCNPI